MNEQEVQFHAALLECGSVANLQDCLMFDQGRTVNTFDFVRFKEHKKNLLAHLERADYFDMYYEHKVHGVTGQQLTPKAALWVGAFYQWLLKQQDLHRV